MAAGRRGRPPAGLSVAERLQARLDQLRLALVDLLEAEPPGSLRVLRERPALEAEIWGVAAQLAAANSDHDQARQYTQDAVRWQAEARKSIDLEAAAKVAELERRLGLGSELGEEIAHLR